MFGNDDTPFHIRALQQHEVSNERKEQTVEKEIERCIADSTNSSSLHRSMLAGSRIPVHLAASISSMLA